MDRLDWDLWSSPGGLWPRIVVKVLTVTDDFLATLAQIAATLLGLLLVGVLFYAETGLRKLRRIAPQTAPYMRAGTIFVLLLYALVLSTSLTLIFLERPWASIAFVVVGLAVLGSLYRFTLRSLELARARPDWLPPIWALAPWPPTLLALALPWLLGGLLPSREAFVAGLLVAGATAFVSTASLVLLTFEVAELE